MMTKLSIELVPTTCWYDNVRNVLTQTQWNALRKHVYAKAGDKCEICGGVGKKHPVECHEKWEYEGINLSIRGEGRMVQRLIGLVALCPMCHKSKHIGLTEKMGPYVFKAVVKHMKKVNGWTTDAAFQRHRAEVTEEWMERSKWQWEIDLTLLLNDEYLPVISVGRIDPVQRIADVMRRKTTPDLDSRASSQERAGPSNNPKG